MKKDLSKDLEFLLMQLVNEKDYEKLYKFLEEKADKRFYFGGYFNVLDKIFNDVFFYGNHIFLMAHRTSFFDPNDEYTLLRVHRSLNPIKDELEKHLNINNEMFQSTVENMYAYQISKYDEEKR